MSFSDVEIPDFHFRLMGIADFHVLDDWMWKSLISRCHYRIDFPDVEIHDFPIWMCGNGSEDVPGHIRELDSEALVGFQMILWLRVLRTLAFPLICSGTAVANHSVTSQNHLI